MKKMFAFLATVSFLAVTTLSTTACGVSQGQEININVNAPEKATNGQDPTKEYVYNDKYLYSQTNINLVIAIASQLAVQRIRENRENIQGTEGTWKEFYDSDEWKTGFFTSFNYDESQFSFKAKDGRDLIFQVKNNDLSDDNNKLRSYWFSNIDMPLASEFDNKDKKITRDGWIHIYLLIGKFKINFDAQLNFVFSIMYDNKNEQSQVILNGETFTKPLGTIDFSHPEDVYNKRIKNISIDVTKENS